MPHAYDADVTIIRERIANEISFDRFRVSLPDGSMLHKLQIIDGLDVRTVGVLLERRDTLGAYNLRVVVDGSGHEGVVAELVNDRGAPEHLHAELTGLIEEAIWGARLDAQGEDRPQLGELTFGELRSALAEPKMRRLARIADRLASMGEEADDMRAYVRQVLGRDRSIPWPVGWVGYAGPGKITTCLGPLLNRPGRLTHGAGVITRWARDWLHRYRAFDRMTDSPAHPMQRHAPDLRLIGLDGSARDVPAKLFGHECELAQWLAMSDKLRGLLIQYGHDCSFLAEVPLGSWADTQSVIAGWKKMIDAVPLDKNGGLRTPMERVHEALSYGPSLHGVAYAAWAAHAPLSWGTDAHYEGIWPRHRRALMPQNVEAINNAVVLPAIHRQLRQLMEVT